MNSFDNPLVTVVICCYREGRFLKECWESVLKQTDDRWMAIMILDGGADEATRKIFNSLRHPKLTKLSNNENLGPYKSLNRGCSLVKTKYYFHLDADDKLPPNSIKEVLDILRKEQCDFMLGDTRLFGIKNKVMECPYPPGKRDIYNTKDSHLIVKKSIWMELGGYTEELSTGYADFDFYISLLENSYKGCHCGGVHYWYRKWSDHQVSESYRYEYLLRRSIIVKRHPDFFKNKLFRSRFLGYGALLDAQNYATDGKVKEAKKSARKALRLGCIDRPMAWYIAFFGRINKNGTYYYSFKKVYDATLKKVVMRLDI